MIKPYQFEIAHQMTYPLISSIFEIKWAKRYRCIGIIHLSKLF